MRKNLENVLELKTLKKICTEDVPKDLTLYFDTIFDIYSVLNEYELYDDSTDWKSLHDKLYSPLKNNLSIFTDTEDELHQYMSMIVYKLNDFGKRVVFKNGSWKFMKKFLFEVLPLIKEKKTLEVKECYLKFTLDKSNREASINSIVDNYTYNENNRAISIINFENLNNTDYLYKYGIYVNDSALKMVDYFNKIDKSKIENMSKTMIDGFLRSLKSQNLSLDGKKFITLRYNLGFEKVAKASALYIESLTGLKTSFFVCEESANKQIDYSHSYDSLIGMSQERIDLSLSLYEKAFKSKNCGTCMGRLYIDVFGQKKFDPKREFIFESNEEAKALDKKFSRAWRVLYDKYTKAAEQSFCIISYPSPEIDEENFEKIFDETIKLNTLNNDKWMNIQSKIIDALDKCSKVRVVGTNGNKTDIVVNLHKLGDNETNFENCTAEVNIPVGEVFTSPVLEETNGTLHVSKVFLNGLEFNDLMFKFEDGKVVDYSCNNFEDEEDNKDFIKEEILFNYESLPIGEFAIGTNTVAYSMSRKYHIEDKLDILIAEKTGPHFALGDTCYSHQEDLELFNPDGKRIIAVDNSISKLRDTEPDKAYFNCHTDITIPYDEVGEIYGICNDKEILIIKDGKFVLDGTEELNSYFE